MRRTKEDAQITRKKILDAAMVVFNRHGYANTRLEDIATEAGVTRGAVYHYFEGKPGVYNTMVNERFQRAFDAIRGALYGGGTPREMLRNLMVKALTLLAEDSEYRTVQELVLFKTAYVPELEEGMDFKRKSIGAAIDYADDLIKQGVETGEFKKDLNTRAAAVAAYGLVGGISSLWLMDSGMFSIEEYAIQMVDDFLNGINAL